MPKLKFAGPLAYRLSSFLALNRIALATYARHALGRRMEPSWDANIEIGIRFWRHQFTKAMSHADMSKGRELFDSLQTESDDVYSVLEEECSRPKGRWYRPKKPTSEAALLYLHGGGYAFNSAVSRRFAAMLAHHTGASLFQPDYRLTPEHPHPAQAEDAFAAWCYVTETVPADKVVVIGDSAGGHMALMLLQKLKLKAQAQPSLCIGLCPWTDIGGRGESLHGNDGYDLVQGWMALRFGEWLDPRNEFGRKELSPIFYDYAGLAPLYLQAGGREILRDMICDFARVQADNGADVMLDLWQGMPHNFQAYDSLKQSSTEAISRICQAIKAHSGEAEKLAPAPNTTLVTAGKFKYSE